MNNRFLAIIFPLLALSVLCMRPVHAAEKPVINPPPTAKDWTDLGKLPDWSGVWTHKRSDQNAQMKTNPPPWNAMAAAQIEFQYAEEKAGRPQRYA